MKPTETQLNGINSILTIFQMLAHDANTSPLKEALYAIINDDNLSDVKKKAIDIVLDKFIKGDIEPRSDVLTIIHAIIETNDIVTTIPYTPPTPIQPWTSPWIPNTPINPLDPHYPWITYFSKTDSTSTTGDSRPDIYAYNCSTTNQHD